MGKSGYVFLAYIVAADVDSLLGVDMRKGDYVISIMTLNFEANFKALQLAVCVFQC